MADLRGYEVPSLTMDEILSSLQSGTLGEIAVNITAEHLKIPMPAIMMQLCMSILEKCGVEVDTLCHPQLNSAGLLQDTAMYINTFKIVHVAVLMRKVLPSYGISEFSITDITSPTPKKVRRFICAAINYFRSWDSSLKTWDEIYSKTAEAVAEHCKLNEEIDSTKKEIEDYEAHNADYEMRRKDMKEKTEITSKELEELHQRKEEKLLVKASLKKKYSEVGNAMEKKQKQIEHLKSEKENLIGQVVGSPKRDMAKKQSLERKVKLMQETHVDWQSKLQEAEKKNKALESMSQHLADVLKTVQDIEGLKENKTKLDEEIMSQTYEIDNNQLTLVEHSQDIANLRQQVASCQEKASRLSARQKQRNIEFKSVRENQTIEKENLESEAGEIHREIRKLEAKIRTMQEKYHGIIQKHKENMKMKHGKQKTIMEVMDQYHVAMAEKLHNSEIFRLLESNK